MRASIEAFSAAIGEVLGDGLTRVAASDAELHYEVPAAELRSVARKLRDDPRLKFEVLIDVIGVDYLGYGEDEWKGASATRTGFSRGVRRQPLAAEAATTTERRFAVVYQLLSITHNQRLSLKVWCDAVDEPAVDSLVDVWAGANWFEREAYDLYGILFRDHPDLRRILTDYGFIGHPFRKDFPLIGNVEVRYDEQLKKVVYEPVSIEERTLVPRVIRHDARYDVDATK
jgi:NADH-quinone oxidoreductase subunit C